jgi:hypothetical protein
MSAIDVDRLIATSLKVQRCLDWSLATAWALVLGSTGVLLFY